MAVREKIIQHLTSRLNDIIPNTDMVKVYTKLINEMSDAKLEAWIQSLENGVLDQPDLSKPATLVTIIAPNLDKRNDLNIERNLKLAEKMGYSFFERCWLTNPVTGQCSLTNRRYLTMYLPIRRQAQTLDAKISLAADNKHVDDLTGQVTGDSKGSSISYPELQMLDAQNLKATLYELMKIRGGDEEALRISTRQLMETGTFSQEELNGLDSVAKVNKALSILFKGMHIGNNLVE
jgi:PHIKZ149|nr:MAG TPA: hypothetical protein [Caudoviricetes sp.]